MSESSREQKRIAHHISNLASADFNTAVRAERYLCHYGVRAHSELQAACNHDDAKVRFRAVWALAKSRHPDAFATVRRLCADPNDEVRYDSVVALGLLQEERALAVLLQMIESGNDEGCAAYQGLWRMMPSAFPRVAELFLSGGEDLRLSLIDTVGGCAVDYGIPEAQKLLSLGASGSLPRLREEAVYWLNELRDRQGVPPTGRHGGR